MKAVKYAWIKEHCDLFPVSIACDVLKVSPSGYYASQNRAPSPRALRHERIKQGVARVHAESYENYGSVKIADQLQKRDDLESACRNTVSSAMREMGLKSRVSKGFHPTTTQSDPTKQPAENRLDRNL